MSKTSVLFIVGGLHRAGAERFAYEIDRALNKDIFNLSILCLEKEKDIPSNWKERYYEKKHIELGTPITYIDRFINPAFFKKGKGLRRLIRKLLPKPTSPWKDELCDYIDHFEVIHWMGEYTYIHSMPEKIRQKSLIHMMSAKFQDRFLYDKFDHDLFYNFCSPFNEDEIGYELSQFKKYHVVYLPLVLQINAENNTWKYQDSPVKKIGIFTRLNRYKPLDPFFYSFQLLLDKMPNCELHVFGNGDPRAEGMLDYLERLGLVDKVFFRGHQENIVQTALNEKLSLSWFQGYNNDRPAGYAGLDICTTGTPLICWDFHGYPQKKVNDTYPHYKNLNKFVEKSLEILTDKNQAENLSETQFTETIKTRDVNIYIQDLEREYLKIAKKSATY